MQRLGRVHEGGDALGQRVLVFFVGDGGGVLLAVTRAIEGARCQARETKQGDRDRNRRGDNAHPVGTAHESCCHCPRLDLVTLMRSTVCPSVASLPIGVSTTTHRRVCHYSSAWSVLYCVSPPIPHAIPPLVFRDVNRNRWDFKVCGGLVKWVIGELHAECGESRVSVR